MGRFDEALIESKWAQEVDPLSLIIRSIERNTLYLARQYDGAIEQFRKALDMDPNFSLAHLFLGQTDLQLVRYQEAIDEYQKALSLSGRQTLMISALGHGYAVSGKRSEALQALAELKDLSKRRYVAPFEEALIYLGLGDKPQALQWLEKAFEDHSQRLLWVKVDPRLDPVRGEPRFQDLLRRMHLTP